MVEVKGGEKFEAALAAIAAKVKAPLTLRVGFLEGATYPAGKHGGESVATVAAIQNFGAPKVGIPPRPFFSNMVKEKSPNWPRALARLLKTHNYDVRKVLQLMGEGIEGQLKQSIRDTNEPPLSPKTVKRKGFDKPLIDTSHMINSTGHEVS